MQLMRELDIPEGSMHIPEEATETVVVLDQTTSVERVAVAAAYGAALLAASSLGVALVAP